MSDILEVGAKALRGADVLGCGCCATPENERHPDGTVCEAVKGYDSPACGGQWAKDGYSCGGKLWDWEAVGAAAVIAAVRPLIEAEVRERAAREIETAQDGYAHDPQASDLRAGLSLALCIAGGGSQ